MKEPSFCEQYDNFEDGMKKAMENKDVKNFLEAIGKLETRVNDAMCRLNIPPFTHEDKLETKIQEYLMRRGEDRTDNKTED